MIPVTVKCLVVVILVVGNIFSARSQHIYVNTSEMVYELTYTNGQCQLEKIPILCNLGASRTIYSIAIYRDTLYRYDPSANRMDTLGQLPSAPAGKYPIVIRNRNECSWDSLQW